MQWTSEEKLNKLYGAANRSANKEFTIYTTAINHLFGSRSMMDNYHKLLGNVLKSLPTDIESINIFHFAPFFRGETFSFEEFQPLEEILYETDLMYVEKHEKRLTEYAFIPQMFPRTQEKLLEYTGFELPQLHILLDMAHLVEYGLHGGRGPTYSGYDHHFLMRINYIYLDYDHFMDGIHEATPNLLKFESINNTYTILKACITEPKTQQIDTNINRDPNACKGRCGMFKRPGSDFCSRCDSDKCKYCGVEVKAYGADLCQTCFDKFKGVLPPMLLNHVPANQYCVQSK
jgi:hypothetical protein